MRIFRVARKWSVTLKQEGITLTMLHPGKTWSSLRFHLSTSTSSSANTKALGWINATEIGDGITEWMNKYNPTAENLTVEQSAEKSMKVLNGLTIEDAGEFYNHDGGKYAF